jgi:glycosyltransferase involved in cell wall biosynthesis
MDVCRSPGAFALIQNEPAASYDPRLVSIVVPVFNEAESLRALHAEIRTSLASWDRPYEIVYVNDGSSDGSAAVLDELAAEANVRAVQLRRNFGQTAALTAGIDHAKGGVIAPLDADLQNDPADIPRLVAKLDEGFDVVSGWRKNRQDATFTRVVPSKIANGIISAGTGVRLHDYGCSLKAYRREVIEGVRLYGEMHRFVPVYAAMQGGRVAEMVVNHRARRFGKSKYGLGRIFKVMLDLLLVKFLASYSSAPMHLFGGFGLICLFLSLLPTGLAVFFKLMPFGHAWHKDFVETPLPVIAAVLLVTGFLSILLGLQAEILMRTYYESQGKRTYLVAKVTERTAE